MWTCSSKLSLAKHADQDGVVKIAGGLSVDGDDGEFAEVAAALKFADWDDRGDVLGFLQHRRRKVMRQVEFANGDFDVDAEVVFAAEDFDDSCRADSAWRRPVGDLDVDDDAFEIGPVGRGGPLLRPALDQPTFFFLCVLCVLCG